MKRIAKGVLYGAVASAAILVSGAAWADEAERRVALFGDVHGHTQPWLDSYVFGIRQTHGDAYRYPPGETIRHAPGHDTPDKRDYWRWFDKQQRASSSPRWYSPKG